MTHLYSLQRRLIAIGLLSLFAVMGIVQPTAAIGRCPGAYHFVGLPAEATFAVTGCVKLTWKTVLTGYVADTSTAAAVFTSNAPKHKANVTLSVITVEADTLADALNQYFGGEVPSALTYASNSKYFSGAAVGVYDATEASSRALDTSIYTFDNDNDYLYILSMTANRAHSAFGRQALKTGQSLTVDVN